MHAPVRNLDYAPMRTAQFAERGPLIEAELPRRRRVGTAGNDPFRTFSKSPFLVRARFPTLPRVPLGAGNPAVRKRVDHPARNEAAIANLAARAALHRLRNCVNRT